MATDLETLVKQLASSNVTDRAGAAEKLNALGEDAAPAAVALVRALAADDEQTREFANSALEGMGPPPPSEVDELEQLLTNENSDVAYWAATLLGRLEGGAVQAVESLKSASADHPSAEVRKRATWALGKIASG
jgi:HEAT repeat protein